MHYQSESEGVPRVAVSIAFADEDWYKTLSRRATLMIQLEERAPVAAGMSMLWVPRDPRAYLDYAHKGRAGYSLMNVFDSKVAGGMAVAALPKGEPGWVSRIRDNFLHPFNESMATYANVILGDDEDESDVDVVPTREELILLSSRRGPTQEPAGKGVSTPPVVDPTVAAAGQKETRTKKREGKKTKGEKTAEEPAISPIRKRSSNVPLLDYVVVSDSLSGLDAGVKRSAPDPDDDVTLTELLAKKQKVLEEKKPSAKSTCSKVDISKITPPTSPPPPPPVPFDVSPPHPDPKGKGKEGPVEGGATEKVVQSVAPGVVVQEGGMRVEGAKTDWESSEATLQGTIYTRRGPPTPGGGGPSGSGQGLEFRRVEGGGSWTEHNPACDDLPHAPHWGLTQGSRMDDLGNSREFYSLSLPPA
ncbi:hypothetical protein HanLR1_Chr17g0679801 [Helianthus annuus]|nr:hypothetical protein HanLR1_Chr17g0679801 [Helianthus annuus]